MTLKTAYGQTFSIWRTGAQVAWEAYCMHPFVEGMRDGTLPRAAFLNIHDLVLIPRL